VNVDEARKLITGIRGIEDQMNIKVRHRSIEWWIRELLTIGFMEVK